MVLQKPWVSQKVVEIHESRSLEFFSGYARLAISIIFK